MAAVRPSTLISLVRTPRVRRAAIATAAFVVITGAAWPILSFTWPVAAVDINVRWKPGVTDAQRVELEQRFRLTAGEFREGTTWKYRLADSSTANIRSIVQDEHVDDTAHLNRSDYRPELAQHRARELLAYSVATGSLGSLLLVLLIDRRTEWLDVSSWSGLARSVSSRLAHARTWRVEHERRPDAASRLENRRATAAVFVAGVLTTAAMTWFADAAPWSAATALSIVYACGYLTGALLIARVDGVSWAVIRTITGLVLTAMGLLLSLVFRLPWFAGPIALVGLAVLLRGRTAFDWPQVAVRIQWDRVAAGILAVILLAPIGITFVYMSPGAFPPVFYNVDTASFLEKVHALVAADTYPPPSLSNLGVQRPHHYGTQAMTAMISRSSGLLPHHALFLIVLPLLTIGVVSAAFAVARYVAPAVPRSISVPLLLISTPSLSSGFWDTFAAQLRSAATANGLWLDRLVGDYGQWGILSNEAKNIGGDFLILSSVAAIAAAPTVGWGLPAFLIGSAIVVKVPVGVALLGGFLFAEAWRAAATRRPRPTQQMLIAGGIFMATYAAFFMGSYESVFRLELFPLHHLRQILESGSLSGFALDLLWLFLPVLIVLTTRIGDPDARSGPFLLMAVAPLVIVNATHLDGTGAAGAGAASDWLQILHAVPYLLHAFALSLASRRWAHLGVAHRTAVLLTMALAIAPVTAAAGRYSVLLLRSPEIGHEFADNRAIGEALAVIPTDGSTIVTNDLRYPADNFTRDNRQFQIPALFGHQAFAVNYAYEVVPFAEKRRALQHMLQQPEWSDAILMAARTHHWTHLVIRNDYPHPAPIPLEQILKNEFYTVFKFP